jgi:hypothetical protein
MLGRTLRDLSSNERNTGRPDDDIRSQMTEGRTCSRTHTVRLFLSRFPLAAPSHFFPLEHLSDRQEGISDLIPFEMAESHTSGGRMRCS